MELMLDRNELGVGEIGGNGRDENARRGGATAGELSLAVRFGLAAAAVWAAWFIMTDPWPAAIAAKAFITVPTGSVPASMGSLFASLR